MTTRRAQLALSLTALTVWALPVGMMAATVDPLMEIRYCGTPARDAAGNIKRSKAVLAAFQRAHPCPATGLRTGSCPSWQMNHAIPLACGGCDAVWNLYWVHDSIKTGTGTYNIDRVERRISAATPPVAGTQKACTFEVIP